VSPSAPMHPCSAPGCSTLVAGPGRCLRHGGPEPAHRWDTDRRPDVKRLSGRANQARRLRLFAQEPFCRMCRAEGRLELAVIADHIIPLAESGATVDDPHDLTKLQPLCQRHSDEKTHREALRGRDVRR
jgi:5-methylcytosine-specific restriction enzyme A